MNVLLIIAGYLLGSLIFSLIIGKILRGTDIRKHGSGNAGATNTLRVLGIGPAILVFSLDVCKGILAVWLGFWFADGNLWVAVLCGLAAIIGHNWPIFFAFRGGKGIATTIGVVATLFFYPALIAGIIAIIMIVITRYVSLGSLIFTALLPITTFIWGEPWPDFIAALVIFVFAFIRHRTNIVRLLQGKENKLGKNRSGSSLEGK